MKVNVVLSILTIDDDPAVLYAMTAMLESMGYVVTPVPSTEEAVARVRRGEVPDAIVSDYRLRDGDNGLAAIQRILREIGKSIPSVIITGVEETPDLLASGVLVLKKPVSPRQLRTVMAAMDHF